MKTSTKPFWFHFNPRNPVNVRIRSTFSEIQHQQMQQRTTSTAFVTLGRRLGCSCTPRLMVLKLLFQFTFSETAPPEPACWLILYTSHRLTGTLFTRLSGSHTCKRSPSETIKHHFKCFAEPATRLAKKPHPNDEFTCHDITYLTEKQPCRLLMETPPVRVTVAEIHWWSQQVQ